MNGNTVVTQKICNAKTEYYAQKRLSVYSMACVAASAIINVAIIAYAVVSALLA